jgi:hypothetical protein
MLGVNVVFSREVRIWFSNRYIDPCKCTVFNGCCAGRWEDGEMKLVGQHSAHVESTAKVRTLSARPEISFRRCKACCGYIGIFFGYFDIVLKLKPTSYLFSH